MDTDRPHFPLTRCLVALAAAAILLPAGCKPGSDSSPKAQPATEEDVESTATLELKETSILPGADLGGSIVLHIPDGWHTYSDPPGDSGMPPIIDFKMPSEWSYSLSPLPEPMRFEDPAGVTFGYEDQLAIGFTIRAPETASAGQKVRIVASVQWLTCKDICLPWSQEFAAELTVIDNNR